MERDVESTRPARDILQATRRFFEQALAHPSGYTEAQMTGKAITSIEQSGLMRTALLEWNGFVAPNINWANLKAHFGEA